MTMRLINQWSYIAPLFFLANHGAGPNQVAPLQIQVEGLDVAQGVVRLALYCEETGFLNEDASCRAEVIPVRQRGTLPIKIDQLDFGRYALAAYHDLNNNGRLDKNNLGIPTEPYAFSNNPMAKWRSPRYSEAVFDFRGGKTPLVLTLKPWSNRR